MTATRRSYCCCCFTALLLLFCDSLLLLLPDSFTGTCCTRCFWAAWRSSELIHLNVASLRVCGLVSQQHRGLVSQQHRGLNSLNVHGALPMRVRKQHKAAHLRNQEGVRGVQRLGFRVWGLGFRQKLDSTRVESKKAVD